MGRGGAYLTAGFIAGSVAALCIRKLSCISISPVAIFSAETIFAAAMFVALLRYRHLFRSHVRNRLPVFLCCAVLFMAGLLNMQRYNGDYCISDKNELRSKSNCKNNSYAAKIREAFLLNLSRIVEKPQDYAVAAALVIGEKRFLSHDTKEAYRNSGAMHILALSGLHIGIIYGLLNILLAFMNFHYFSRQLKFFICTILIFSYAAITGFSASVQRAAIMVTVWKVLALSGRKCGKWDVLLLSACIILLIEPGELENIGFQLSFAAVAGIIGLYPTLSGALEVIRQYQIYKFIKPLWNSLCISIACQITTAPLVWYHFHNFSFYFLITNIVAVPIATISLYAIVFSAITCNIPLIGDFLGIMAQLSIHALNFTIRYIGTT